MSCSDTLKEYEAAVEERAEKEAFAEEIMEDEDDGEEECNTPKTPTISLPNDDGESSGDEEGNGKPRSFYTLSREIVERKRAEEKRRKELQEANADENSNENQDKVGLGFRRAGSSLGTSAENAEVPILRKRKSLEKRNYSAFVPGFIVERLNERGSSLSFEKRKESVVLCTQLNGLTEAVEQAGFDSWSAPTRKMLAALEDICKPLFEIIDAYGGDIVKVQRGNTLVSLWLIDDTAAITIRKVVNCARKMNQVASISSGIGCGSTTCLCFEALGPCSETASNYADFCIAGPALDSAYRLCADAEIGQVELDTDAMKYLRNSYSDDNEASDSDQDECTNNTDDDSDQGTEKRRRSSILRPTETVELARLEFHQLARFVPRNLDLSLRHRYSHASSSNRVKTSEYRQITVCALRLGIGSTRPEDNIPQKRELVELLHATAERLQGTVLALACDQGVLEVRLVFGLPGALFEESAVRAMAAVFLLRDLLLESHGIQLLAGVTTGYAFCGVIGSETRAQYCVMGEVCDQANVLLDQEVKRMTQFPTTKSNSIIACPRTVESTRHELEYEDERCSEAVRFSATQLFPSSGGLPSSSTFSKGSSLAPVGWRRRGSQRQQLSKRLSVAQKSRYRQVSLLFEEQRKSLTCAITGVRSLTAAKLFIEESIPLLCRVHGFNLLRTQPSLSSYDDGALALSTSCGAWRRPLVLALEIIEAHKRKSAFASSVSPSVIAALGSRGSSFRATFSTSGATMAVSSKRHSLGAAPQSPPRSPGKFLMRKTDSQPKLNSATRTLSRSSMSCILSPRSSGDGSCFASPRAPSSPRSPREMARRFFFRKTTSFEPLGDGESPSGPRGSHTASGRSLAHLLSKSKRGAALSVSPGGHEDIEISGCSLQGRANAVFAALPSRLHKYADVLNDMFMPEEREDALSRNHPVDAEPETLMMRQARLVQLVVIILLQAAKRNHLCLLVDTLEHMDAASWDVLYKVTKWQKKYNRPSPFQKSARLEKEKASSAGADTYSNSKKRRRPRLGNPFTALDAKVLKGAVRRRTSGASSSKCSTSSSSRKSGRRCPASPPKPPKSSAVASSTMTSIKKPTDSIDLDQFAAELESSNRFCVFVLAPLSNKMGLHRAEWLETQRLAEASGAYIDVHQLDMEEALLFAAKRLKLCAAGATDEEKEHAVDSIRQWPKLVDLIAATHAEIDLLNAMLAQAKEHGKLRTDMVGDGESIASPEEMPSPSRLWPPPSSGGPVPSINFDADQEELEQESYPDSPRLPRMLTPDSPSVGFRFNYYRQPRNLWVADDIDTLEPPISHASAMLGTVDALPTRKQYVITAASIYKRVSPRLLRATILIDSELAFIEAMCADLCKPLDSGRVLFKECAPTVDDSSLSEALGGSATERFFVFDEPMLHRAVACRLLDSQIGFARTHIHQRAAHLDVDDCAYLHYLVVPCVQVRRISASFNFSMSHPKSEGSKGQYGHFAMLSSSDDQMGDTYNSTGIGVTLFAGTKFPELPWPRKSVQEETKLSLQLLPSPRTKSGTDESFLNSPGAAIARGSGDNSLFLCSSLRVVGGGSTLTGC